MPSPLLSRHPLDLLPVFRKWPPSRWRNLVYTAVLNLMIALSIVTISRMFHDRGISFWQQLLPSLLVSNLVGYLTHGGMVLGDRLLQGWPSRATGLPRVLYYMALVGSAVILGILIGTSILTGKMPWYYLERPSAMLSLLRFTLFASIFMAFIIVAGERRIERETLAARQREEMANAAQLLAEARLRALQAQIEPHFLYNTLANVVGLIDTRPAQARHMLERFIDYLRASLAASRAETSTLGTELDLAAAYLDVLAVRMGQRLRYRIEAADGCRDFPIAPMLLQPVIENAVAHGLEPKVEGGEIIIRASCQDRILCIEVADTGAGLAATAPKPGGGVGLSNLRARLRSLYGQHGQVQLLENQPSGITVRITLPLKENVSSTSPAP